MDKAEASQMELASGRMKLNEARQGEQEKNALRALVSGGGDMTDAASVLRVAPTIGADILKKYGEIGKQRAEIGGITAKTGMDAAHAGQYSANVLDSKLARTRSFAQNIQTPQDAAMYIRGIYSDPELAPIYSKFKTQEQAEAAIPQTAAELAQWKAAHVGMTGEQLMKLLAPKMQVVDAGTTKELIGTNGLTGQVVPDAGTSVKVGVTPSAQLSSDTARRGQDKTAATAANALEANQSAPHYMETEAGLVALPKKLGSGQIPAATIVTGPNGESLGKPLKTIPANVNTAIITNDQSKKQVERALTLLSGINIGDPTKGGMRGDAGATGFKGMLPQAILNRVDPSGVDARAEVADIGSLKIHDRSGAAVTISESPRLMPFVPQATDDNATVIKKLRRLKLEIDNESNALRETYSKEQGYKPSPVNSKPPEKDVKVGKESLKAKLAPDGKYYVQRNGTYFEVKE